MLYNGGCEDVETPNDSVLFGQNPAMSITGDECEGRTWYPTTVLSINGHMATLPLYICTSLTAKYLL